MIKLAATVENLYGLPSHSDRGGVQWRNLSAKVTAAKRLFVGRLLSKSRSNRLLFGGHRCAAFVVDGGTNFSNT